MGKDSSLRRSSLREDESDARPSSGKSGKSEATRTRMPFSAIGFATGLAIMLVGPLILRVYCELAIVFFKIHDELKEMNDRPRRSG